MGVIGIGVGTAKMGRICRDKDGNITEQSTARWDVDPDGGSVAIWPMDPEKMEPSRRRCTGTGTRPHTSAGWWN